jgi:hypothetical protein
MIDAIFDDARRVGRDGGIVRSLVALAAFGSWTVAGAVGHVNWPVTVVALIVGAAAVRSPDSIAPVILIVVMIATWMIEVRPASPGWSLVLALSVLFMHAASARAAALGEGAALDGRAARRWLAQTAVVGVATAGLWAAVLLLDDASVSGGAVLSAAAVAAVIGFAVVVARVAAAGRPG